MIAYVLGRLAQRYRAPEFADLRSILAFRKRTGIPLALYLRSFTSDGRADHRAGPEGWGASDEEEVAAGFASHALFVALGKPGDSLPGSGAYRLWVDDRNWQQVVGELITDASAILFRWTPGDALEWELGQVIARGKLGHTAFLLPPAVHGQVLREFLPKQLGDLPDVALRVSSDDRNYAAFFAPTAEGGRFQERDPSERLEEAAARTAERILGLPPLTRHQLTQVRRLHGRIERAILWLGRFCIAVPTVAIAGVGLLLADMATLELLPYGLLDPALKFAGIAVVASLALFFLGAGLISRSLGRT